MTQLIEKIPVSYTHLDVYKRQGVELIEVNIDIDQIALIKNGEIVEKRTTKVKKSLRSERTRISSSRK